MRYYKSTIALGLLIALVLSLSGCIVIPMTTYYDLNSDEVESISFYDLRESVWDDYPGEFIINNTEPTFILPTNRNRVFLRDFADLRFTDSIIITLAAMDPSFAYGDWVVRIDFTNGESTCYSCFGYGATYAADGTRLSMTHYSCEKEELELLLKKYMEFQKPMDIPLK